MNAFDAVYGELAALRGVYKLQDNSAFAKTVESRLSPSLEKPFAPELPEALGIQRFSLGELTKANDIIKQIFGKECSLQAEKSFSHAEGASFASEISLKHSRSGKYNIDGQLCECLHINVMNLVGVMESKNGARTFLVRAHQSNFLVCLIELPKDFLKGNQISLKSFRTMMAETFKQMEPTSDQLHDWDLWVPNFRLRSVCDKAYSEVWSKSDKEDHLVSYFGAMLESRSDGELIQRQAGDKSIVLSEGFVIGVMDTAHEDKLDLPVFAALVTPDCFVAS